MKTPMRDAAKERRQARSRHELVAVSRAITHRLEGFPPFEKAKSILFYVSKEEEIRTHELIKRSLTSKHVFVPRLEEKQGIQVCRIKAFGELTVGKFNVLEPKQCKPSALDRIDVVVVPGLAFDRRGYRLGYGLGYYDQLLEGFKGIKIGVCAYKDIIERVPNDKYDIAVDFIVTENETITVTA